MRVLLKPGLLVLAADTDAERDEISAWRSGKSDHVFHLTGGSHEGLALHDLGPRAEACREPINILFDRVEPPLRLISNLAATPFVLHGRGYASIEGFWQGLRFEAAAERARIAKMWGTEAKRAAKGAPEHETFTYDGKTIPRAGPAHRRLMEEASRAKFAQHLEAREALLSTGTRPLTHRPRRDSTTIPGAMMADIWMRIREELRG